MVYVHCTIGLGRAHAVAIAYIFCFCGINVSPYFAVVTLYNIFAKYFSARGLLGD